MIRLINKLLKMTIQGAIIILISLLIFDGIIYFILHNPGALPDNPVTRFVRLLNISEGRNHPSYNPACSQYDQQFNYRYKPGQCQHTSWEYDVTIKANSQGFPDDEFSLSQPEIIVVGDSYAAGWGVEQYDAFPAVLEKISGKKVLSAALPSYATGRELALLNEIDLSAATTIVIQYSDNDGLENQMLFQYDQLTPMHRMVYDAITEGNIQQAKFVAEGYFPGKYLKLIYFMFSRPPSVEPPKPNPRTEHLLEIISKSKLADLEDIHIIILSVYQSHLSDVEFQQALAARLASDNSNLHYSRITPLGTSEQLNKDDYYILDDHLRPSGHEKVARLLNQVIK